VIGGVVPVVHIPGVAPGQLVLDGPTLASISWKHLQLERSGDQETQPDLNLPNQAIVTVHRSDASGTVYIFTNFLTKVSPNGNSGPATPPPSIGRRIGAKGSEGLPETWRRPTAPSGLSNMPMPNRTTSPTQDDQQDGKTVSPVAAAFGAAASGAAWTPQRIGTMLTDQPGAETWPIAGATWVLFYKNRRTGGHDEGLKFFQWSYKNGDQMASGLDYVPFPDAVKQKITASWTQVQGWNGGT